MRTKEITKDMVYANCGALRMYAKGYARKKRSSFSTMMDKNGVSNAALANAITKYRTYATKFESFKIVSSDIEQDDIGYISLAVLTQICCIFETDAVKYVINQEKPEEKTEVTDTKSTQFEDEIAKLNQLMQAQSNKTDAMLECMIQMMDYMKEMRDMMSKKPYLTDAGNTAAKRDTKPINYGYDKEAKI